VHSSPVPIISAAIYEETSVVMMYCKDGTVRASRTPKEPINRSDYPEYEGKDVGVSKGFAAVEQQNVDKLKKALSRNPDLVNARRNRGHTLLHAAALNDWIEGIRILAGTPGVDIDIPTASAAFNDYIGETVTNATPLMFAFCAENVGATRALLELGARIDPHAAQFAVLSECKKKETPCLRALLEFDAKADRVLWDCELPNRKFWVTPLGLAIIWQRNHTARALLEADVDPDVQGICDDHLSTPTLFLVKGAAALHSLDKKQKDIFAMLVAADAVVDLVTETGERETVTIASQARKTCLEELLEAGLAVRAED